MPSTKHSSQRYSSKPNYRGKAPTKVYVKKVPPVEMNEVQLLQILARLETAQELGRACQVCKRWNTFIGTNENVLWKNIYAMELRDTSLPITKWKEELRNSNYRYLVQNPTVKKDKNKQNEKERIEQIREAANVDIVDSESNLRFKIQNWAFVAEYEIGGKKGLISLWTEDRRRAVRDFIPVARYIMKNFEELDEEATSFAADPSLYELETDEDEELDEGKEEDEKIARCYNEEDSDLHMDEPTEMTRGEFKARLRQHLPAINVRLEKGFYSKRHWPTKFSFGYNDDEMFYGESIACMFTQDREADYFMCRAGLVSSVN
eukprot:Phypoly_transcript_06805.p1 GENE.Phypoly_transcript_06805~~Phypoly_transcript_06805.p1  ORF type:complete len:319 (+),score=48.05 Phypoly_transcript_06805:436-1392(+)